MHFLFVLLIVCIVMMVAYGRDSIRTSTRSQLQISPTNIKMDSEGKNSINNNYILYSRKNSAAKTTYDAVNKRWTWKMSTQKVKEPKKINKDGLNIQNRIPNNTISIGENIQMALIRPKLRQVKCPEGMARNNRGECALKFSDY
ncbi:unnamed protein product [Macrosiphum euphorbiae]|uniref:Uncharacterized protein n=1 Tax=Macrosiphum euphorbiae TaxID=13131 RepID=A0AAV0X606_9HEMI|nr:unnamed protein product [Macrosiphum euphorbiae]